MSKGKIINDPVFGFINVPTGFLLKVFQHKYVERLSRIKQLGLASLVYPGAQHTRFQHTTGAMHLMSEAVNNLRNKGCHITDEEKEAVIAAIILHDVGHGPLSHVLENSFLLGVTHEDMSVKMMEEMNKEFNGKLDLCIKIFKDEYHKKFLHQLVSSNLDMDRLDYLRRDCFFTGVNEGNIGSARIIKMLEVKDDKLVVEAKGIYSIENFLLSRRLMYWQVYLHKTSIAAEGMVSNLIKRAKELIKKGISLPTSKSLEYFLEEKQTPGVIDKRTLDFFYNLDDNDLWTAIKEWQYSDDIILSTLSHGLLERNIFKIIRKDDKPIDKSIIEEKLSTISSYYNITIQEAKYFIYNVNIFTNMYKESNDKINILYKDGTIKPITDASDMLNLELLSKEVHKYYMCFIRAPFNL